MSFALIKLKADCPRAPAAGVWYDEARLNALENFVENAEEWLGITTYDENCTAWKTHNPRQISLSTLPLRYNTTYLFTILDRDINQSNTGLILTRLYQTQASGFQLNFG